MQNDIPVWLVAVDPGVRATGIAVYANGRLASASTIRGSSVAEACAETARALTHWRSNNAVALYVEIPVIYPAAKQHGDPNDLIAVAAVAGSAIGMFGRGAVQIVTPRVWKGQTPKGVVHARACLVLDAEEKKIANDAAAAVGKTIGHNVWDAVSLGLWALGRARK